MCIMLRVLTRIVALLAASFVFTTGPSLPLRAQSSLGEGRLVCCNIPVPAGNWVGTDHYTSCDEYMRENGRVRESMCAVLKNTFLPSSCALIDRYCAEDSCKKFPAVGAPIFALSPTAGVVRLRVEPRSSAPGATAANGTKLMPREIRQIDGKTWYYVTPAGLPAGWIEASDVVCSRPRTTPPPPCNMPCYWPDPFLGCKPECLPTYIWGGGAARG